MCVQETFEGKSLDSYDESAETASRCVEALANLSGKKPEFWLAVMGRRVEIAIERADIEAVRPLAKPHGDWQAVELTLKATSPLLKLGVYSAMRRFVERVVVLEDPPSLRERCTAGPCVAGTRRICCRTGPGPRDFRCDDVPCGDAVFERPENRWDPRPPRWPDEGGPYGPRFPPFPW